MKNKHFLFRLLNLTLILCILGAYQTVLHARRMQEALTEMQTKVRQLEGEMQAWEQALKETAQNKTTAENGAAGDKTTQEGTEGVSAVESTKTGYVDGTYQGTAQGFGGAITVSVTVSEGSIVSLDLVSAGQEDEAYLSMAEEIIDRIVENQTTEVDTVSGATYSSAGIRDAAAQALLQAEQGE